MWSRQEGSRWTGALVLVSFWHVLSRVSSWEWSGAGGPVGVMLELPAASVGFRTEKGQLPWEHRGSPANDLRRRVRGTRLREKAGWKQFHQRGWHHHCFRRGGTAASWPPRFCFQFCSWPWATHPTILGPFMYLQNVESHADLSLKFCLSLNLYNLSGRQGGLGEIQVALVYWVPITWQEPKKRS